MDKSIGSEGNTSRSNEMLLNILKPLVYIGSTVAGLMTARTYINDAAYDNLKKNDAFSDVLPEHNKRLRSLFENAKHDIHQPEKNVLFPLRVRMRGNIISPNIEKRMHNMGIKNVLDEWAIIHRSQRQNSVILGITVTSVALGAALSVMGRLEKFSDERNR